MKAFLAGTALFFAFNFQACAYELGRFDDRLDRAELRCDDGRFVGYLYRDNDGYYSGGPAGNVSRDISEVINRMLRDMPGECR
jgi:hypothetical protein